jgi:hypothetical protein
MNNETLEILNKTIDNGYITDINWLWVYSDENVLSYTISGVFFCINNGLVLDKNIKDDVLLVILKNNLDMDGFRAVCYSDLGLNNI